MPPFFFHKKKGKHTCLLLQYRNRAFASLLNIHPVQVCGPSSNTDLAYSCGSGRPLEWRWLRGGRRMPVPPQPCPQPHPPLRAPGAATTCPQQQEHSIGAWPQPPSCNCRAPLSCKDCLHFRSDGTYLPSCRAGTGLRGTWLQVQEPVWAAACSAGMQPWLRVDLDSSDQAMVAGQLPASPPPLPLLARVDGCDAFARHSSRVRLADWVPVLRVKRGRCGHNLRARARASRM